MLFQILNNPAQKDKGIEDKYYVDRTQRVITHLYGWIQKAIQFYAHKISAKWYWRTPRSAKTGDFPRFGILFSYFAGSISRVNWGGSREGEKNCALQRIFVAELCGRIKTPFRSVWHFCRYGTEAKGKRNAFTPKKRHSGLCGLQWLRIALLWRDPSEKFRQLTFATQWNETGNLPLPNLRFRWLTARSI